MPLFSTLFSDAGESAARQAERARTKGLKKAREDIEQIGPLAQTGYTRGTGLVDTAETRALGLLNTGIDEAQGYLSGAVTPFEEQYGQDQLARQMYLNSLGLGGAEGTAAAQGAFQTGPGYEFQLGQGLDAINRRRNAAGMLRSGNADIDAIRFGSGLAGQEFGAWQNRLAGFDPMASAQARAGVLTNLAQLFQGLGQQGAGLAERSGRQRVGLSSDLTGQQINMQGALAGNQTQLGQSRAQGVQDAYAASASRDAGLLNALLAAGGLGAKAFGMGGFGSSSASIPSFETTTTFA